MKNTISALSIVKNSFIQHLHENRYNKKIKSTLKVFTIVTISFTKTLHQTRHNKKNLGIFSV